MIFKFLKRTFPSLLRKSIKPSSRSNSELMKIAGHQFTDPEILDRALTHRSALHEVGGNNLQSNELLEFLGDAVLGLIVVEHLYRKFPDKSEGDLSKIKSMLVSGISLKKIAEKINLGAFIKMSRNEARNGGRNRSSILEDTFEALIAAVYLDAGIDAARRFVNKFVLYEVDRLVSQKHDNNFKSQLLEYTQGQGSLAPEYIVTGVKGPEHRKRFEIEVHLDGVLFGSGDGNTKKAAQQIAAREAIKRLTASGLIF